MADKSSLDQIADIDPRLRASYDAELAYWHPEKPPITMLASSFANAVAVNVDEISGEALTRIFTICESALDGKVSSEADALATGFLESLQHADGRETFDFRQIAGYLGPASKAHCVAMDRFHGASTRGLL